MRRREDRALRRLPTKQRAARREQIEHAREQRVQQRQQQNAPAARAAGQAQPAAAARNARAANRGLRRNGQARVTPQAARRGRFAAAAPQALQAQAVNARTATANARASRTAAHRAWRHGHRARFVGWYGPVFYPYAYSDIFDYAFWPGGYDDDYWYTAYDDFFDGVYYGEVGPPAEYLPETTGALAREDAMAHPTYKSVAELCKQPGSGITAWPIAEIQQKVGLNGEQKDLLNGVKDAGAKAASVFKATCPSENAFPMTPPGRLASMTARLDATLEAVQTVRPSLEKFYNSLSDEQKERFNEIGPDKAVNKETQAALPDDAKKCGEAKPGLTNLPIEQIEDAIKPNDKQGAALDALGEATVKAVGVLQAACPSETPLTPPGRLQAIETRLQAMADAAKTVKPALDEFYASLSSEQKARFNRLGSDLAQQETTGSK
ncbi:MAG TPA: Spy/CpxP family protein refolding chaperone [Pseudolabrys sp.]|nr:Spy/CpxP family protein refolding chaperone [Pseudolabrys sp.]